jgi:hypothetical protein
VPLFVLAGVGGQEVLLMLAGQKDRCSKIRNKQDNARHMTSRRAHPAVTFFGTLISRSFSFVCAVSQFIFSLSVQGSFFVYQFTFSFAFSFTFGFRLFLLRFSFRVFFVESWCQLYRRSSSFVPSFAYGPFCEDTSGSRCDAAPGVASVVVSRRVLSTSGSSADVVLGSNSGSNIFRKLRADSPIHYRFNI